MRSSSNSCSSTESTSFSVETWCCASTSRQQVPLRSRASDDSASSVHVLDDIHQPGHGLNKRQGFTAQRGVAVLEPRAGNRIVAPNDGIEGSIKTHEQYREFER